MKAIPNWMKPLAALAAYLAITVTFFRAYSRDPAHLHGIWWLWADQGEYHRDALAWAAGNLDPGQHLFSGLCADSGPIRSHYTVESLFDPGSCFAHRDCVADGATRPAPGAGQVFFAALSGLGIFYCTGRLPRGHGCLGPALGYDTHSAAVLMCAAGSFALPRIAIGTAGPGGRVGGGAYPCLPADRWAGLRCCECHLLRRAFAAAAAAALGTADRRCGAGCAFRCSTWWPGLFGDARAAVSVYMTLVRNFGFEFRLLPFQWVTVMLGTKPVLASSHVLLREFPWIFTGLTAVLAAILGARAGKPACLSAHRRRGGNQCGALFGV
jgi:hypothetical protein